MKQAAKEDNCQTGGYFVHELEANFDFSNFLLERVWCDLF